MWRGKRRREVLEGLGISMEGFFYLYYGRKRGPGPYDTLMTTAEPFVGIMAGPGAVPGSYLEHVLSNRKHAKARFSLCHHGRGIVGGRRGRRGSSER